MSLANNNARGVKFFQHSASYYASDEVAFCSLSVKYFRPSFFYFTSSFRSYTGTHPSFVLKMRMATTWRSSCSVK